MEQPMIDEMDNVAEPRDAQTDNRGVHDRLEGVEDELKLLKSEVKQTLIDIREFVMKGSAITVTSVFDEPNVSPSNGLVVDPEPEDSPPPEEPPTQPESVQVAAPIEQDWPTPQEPAPALAAPPVAIWEPAPAPALQNARVHPQTEDPMDAVKMGHIVGWLGTAVEKGLTLKQLKPVLQAYERTGHLTPTLALFIYGTLGELETDRDRSRFSLSRSPAEVSQCLQELHEIIVNPQYVAVIQPPADNGHDG